jgi:VCBS repeat-containing protein
MGWHALRYHFDFTGGTVFTEGSGAPLDFASVGIGATGYNSQTSSPPPGVPPLTSVTSITVAIQNAEGTDTLALDIAALTPLVSQIQLDGFGGGTIWTPQALIIDGQQFMVPLPFAFFSGGQNGQPLVISLAHAATQSGADNTASQPAGADLTLFAQIIDHITYVSTDITPPASKTVTYSFDGQYGFGSPSVSITINPVNSQPILTNTATVNLGTGFEPLLGSYFRVSQFRQSMSDADGPNTGIAITGATSNNGHWEYSIDGRTNWLSFNTVSGNSSLLLRDTDWVRFVPDGSLAGGQSGGATITYRGWDQFGGTAAGTKVDTSSPNGQSPYTSSTASASITLIGVNDAPVLPSATATLTTINENQTANGGQTVASFGGTINDIDGGALKGIAITGQTVGNGHWEFSTNNGSSWTSFGTVAGNDALLLRDTDLVRFIPDAQNGTSASLIFSAWDQTSGTAGGRANLTTAGATGRSTAFSTGSNTANLTVTSVNDAPTADNLTQTVVTLEDTPTGPLGIVVADVDANETITATLKVDNPVAGSLSVTGGGSYDAGTGIWTITGSVSVVNAALAAVTFVPAPSSNLATTITTHIVDTAGTGPADGAISITVTPVNDPPTVTGATQTHSYTEGDSSVALDPIVVADLDASDTVTVTLTLANPAAGTIAGGGGTFAGGVWTFTGTVAQANTAIAALSFIPGTDNDVNTTIAVRVRDAAGTGPALDSTITLNVTPVEDIATITTVDVVNSEAKLPSLALFSIASKVTIIDPDTDDAAAPMKYVAGSGSVSNIDGPVPPDESLADLLTLDADTGQVIYDRSAFRWLADGESVVYTITFLAKSGDDPAQEETITITINGLNDAPVLATPNHATFAATTEDSPPGAARTVGSFRGSVTDGDPSPLTGIAITATVGQGDWQYSTDGGATWTAFVASDASSLLLRDTDLLRFAPDGKNGGEASFTYRAWDQTSGQAGDFADTSTNGSATAFSRQTDVVTLAVTSINDAPVMTPDHMTLLPITEDETANGGQPVWTFLCNAIGDVDDGAVQGIALTGLTSGNGHWEYSLDGGTTWTSVGTVSESAALLLRHDDWMRFVPDGKNGTSATLTYHAWDQTTGAAGDSVDLTVEGATGGTTAYSTLTDTVSIAVFDVNDAPVVTGAVTLAPFNEDTARVITLAELLGNTSDVDTGDTLSVTDLVLVGNGSLVDNGDDTWTYTPADDDDTSASFTYKVSDGIAPPIDTSATLDITPVNDAPVAQDGAAGGDEDTTVSGTLVATDVDNPSLIFSLETQAAHGTVTVNPNGTYSYVPNANYFGTDSFTFRASDGLLGSVATVNLTVDSVNDPPVVTGPVTLLAVKEDTARLITEAELLANASDADGPLSVTDLVLIGNGDLVDNGDDTWTYTPDADDDTSVSFTYKVGDGIAAAIVTSANLDLTPVNDAPVSQNDIAGGNEDTTIAGSLTATDVDNQSLTYSLLTQAAHGTVTVNPNGSYSYQPDANYNGPDSFTFQVFDGATTGTATVDLVVGATNDAPVNIVPMGLSVEAGMDIPLAGLAITDVDAGGGSLSATLSVTHGKLTIGAAGGAGVSGNGSSSVTLTGTLAAISATLAAAKNVIYHTDAGFTGTDTLTIATADNGNAGSGGALLDTDQVNLFWQHVSGAGGNDTFAALPGYERIDAGGGTDTVTFGFNLTDATITWVGNQVIVDTSTSHTVLTGVETYVFADGTVNNNDGDVLVDDLYYYATHHDVWNAHADADAHYHGIGWKEWRDPSAFFSTSFYLATNPDVKASGADPLTHFHQAGWSEGRQPSMTFDTAAFLKANPDIAAAHIDPLAHFMQLGASEGRQPIALTSLIAANGFDYVYYLQHNPDVAAAHVDPFQHFQTTGWKEGRDPNALFDTEGYLATYADVKAAGINPLDHYHTVGWKEGRDPSVSFDTTEYISHYFDVAVANIDPLEHFLRSGLHEGRSAFADGVWG